MRTILASRQTLAEQCGRCRHMDDGSMAIDVDNREFIWLHCDAYGPGEEVERGTDDVCRRYEKEEKGCRQQ